MRRAVALSFLSLSLLAADKPKEAPKKDAKEAKVEEPKKIPSWFNLLPDTADELRGLVAERS